MSLIIQKFRENKGSINKWKKKKGKIPKQFPYQFFEQFLLHKPAISVRYFLLFLSLCFAAGEFELDCYFLYIAPLKIRIFPFLKQNLWVMVQVNKLTIHRCSFWVKSNFLFCGNQVSIFVCDPYWTTPQLFLAKSIWKYLGVLNIY